MDFLEIRRKAKERAEARAHAGATPSRERSEAVATGDARPAAAPSREAVELVPAASEALEAVPRLEPLGAPEPPQREPPPPLDAIEEAPAAPDFSRLEPFDAVVEAVHAAGGELTPIPDIPPWNEALSPDAEEAGRDGAASARPWTPALATPPLLDPLDDFFYREGEVVPGLPALDFGAPALAREVEAVDPLHEYLTFRLGDEEYAIDIERVREVLKAPVITDVPRAPAHVLGVIMVRGDVIAVFDPRRRLGLPEVDRPRTSRVLVCDDGLGPIGLLVDTVSQVVRLRRADIEPRPQGIGRVSAEYISGIGRQAGRMFIVLDLPVVLRGKSAADGEEAA